MNESDNERNPHTTGEMTEEALNRIKQIEEEQEEINRKKQLEDIDKGDIDEIGGNGDVGDCIEKGE